MPGGRAGLLGVGAVALVRSLPGWWKLVAIPAALAILLFVLYPMPNALYATNVPRPAKGDSTPADRGLDFVDAEFVTVDGVTLSGWYLPSTHGAAVVVLHGASSTRTAVLDHAVVLAEHGYGVLLYDARGHGRSGGTAMEFGWYGDLDIAAALSYLESRPEVDPARSGAVGMSMGGEQVVGAAATDTRIHAVVGEGGTRPRLRRQGLAPPALARLAPARYRRDALRHRRPAHRCVAADQLARRRRRGRPDARPAHRRRRGDGERRGRRRPVDPGRLAGHRRAVGRARHRAHGRAAHPAGGMGGHGDRVPGQRAPAVTIPAMRRLDQERGAFHERTPPLRRCPSQA
jgi:alpha-beta hydrolase superfamily lysophospholipase